MKSRSSGPTLSGTQSFGDEKRKKYGGMMPYRGDGLDAQIEPRLGAAKASEGKVTRPLGTTFCWTAHGQRALNESLEVLARLSDASC